MRFSSRQRRPDTSCDARHIGIGTGSRDTLTGVKRKRADADMYGNKKELKN